MRGKIYFECPGEACFVEHETHFGISDQDVVCLDCGTRFVPHDVVLGAALDEDSADSVDVVNGQGYAQLGLFNDCSKTA